MKAMSISAIIVAGVLVAFGMGLMGQPLKSNDSQVANASAATDVKKEGSCCGSGAVQVATDGTEKPSCCSASTQNVLVSTGTDEKKECAGGACCKDKSANVLTSTEAGEKKQCAGGACCQEKNANVLTSTDAAAEKACDGKKCSPDGKCCEAREAANVLTSTPADEKKECAGGACCKDKSANVLTSTGAADDKKCEAGQCAECPVSAAMAKLPKMTYMVGTEKTCCSEQAKTLAEQHKAPIQYVVAEKTYDCPTAAMTALVEETETFVAAFTSPKKCEASGNTTIAGHSVACPVEAEKQTTLVTTAIESVKMEYEVAGEKANCPSCAATKSKEKSAPVEYVVGDQKTTCELTARLNLAHAKYKAAVQALAAKTVTTETNAG